MRESPLLSDLLTLRLALGDKDGGPPPGNNINWVRYSPSQPPASEPDVGTRIVDAPSPQNQVITDDTTSFRAIDPVLANPVTLLRDLGVLPRRTESSPPLRLAQRPPKPPPAARDKAPSPLPAAPQSEPTPDQKARASTITAAALAGYDADPNNCNISFIAAMRRLGIHDFDGMLANDILAYMKSHPDKYRPASKDEAAEAANRGAIVAAGVQKVRGHGHIQTIISGPAREPEWMRKTGELLPLAVSGTMSTWVGSRSR